MTLIKLFSYTVAIFSLAIGTIFIAGSCDYSTASQYELNPIFSVVGVILVVFAAYKFRRIIEYFEITFSFIIILYGITLLFYGRYLIHTSELEYLNSGENDMYASDPGSLMIFYLTIAACVITGISMLVKRIISK